MEYTDSDGKKYQTKFYNLDAIISVGYRVNSAQATQFRIWASPTSEIAKNFYAMIQNKFHFAITGKTTAEIIYETANKQKPFMGLKTCKNSPKGRILKSDTVIAKKLS